MMELQDPLKPRELEVLRLMADGLTNREIGETLYIGVETVRWYAKQIYSKMAVSGREEAAEKAQALGLLDEEPAEAEDALPNNLPPQVTDFIGRETELNDLQGLLLEDQKRLVTVLAPGGMGKTRLALEVGAGLVRAIHESLQDNTVFSDGIFFVPLQPLSDPANIIHAIAHHAGYQFQNDGREPKQQVLDFLSVKNALLLLDNWEHLIEGAPIVSEIMNAAPNVTVLATSREKLNLSGETLYSLQGMRFPEWETPADALEYDAVQLLVQSARRVKPDWDVTQDNLDYVARACRITAGMPLAIILASAWLDMLTLEEITVEIQKNADFLETEMRDVPDRQRSIRAVFEYTWQRLEPAQRDIFMKLSVFRDGFTRHAAENVANANLRLLHRLSDKALISRNPDGRFEIHELLRQYGEAELDNSPLADDIYAAHSQHYLTGLAEMEPQIKGHGQLEALDEVEAELENISRAWNYALETGAFERVRDAAEALCWALHFRSREPEGRVLFEAAQDALANQPERELIWAHITLCHQHLGRRDWATLEIADRAIQIAQQHDDNHTIALGFLAQASILHSNQEPERAAEAAKQAHNLYEMLNDRFYIGYMLNRMGFYFWVRGDVEAFANYTERAASLQRASGDEANLCQSLHNLGLVYSGLTRYKQGLEYLHESVYIAQRINSPSYLSSGFAYLSMVYTMRGETEQATSAILESEKIANILRKQEAFAYIQVSYAALALFENDFVRGETAARQALESLQGVNPVWITTIQLLLLLTLFGQGRFSEVEENLPSADLVLRTNFPIWNKQLCAIKALYWAQTGEPIKATAMLAFTYSDTIDAYHWFKEMPLFQNTHQQLQSELDEETFKAAWERGEQMSMEAALAFALEEG